MIYRVSQCAESVQNHASPQNPIIWVPKGSPSEKSEKNFNVRPQGKPIEVYAVRVCIDCLPKTSLWLKNHTFNALYD